MGLLAAAIAPAPAADATTDAAKSPTPSDAPRNYVIFVGLNIQTDVNGTPCPVVSGDKKTIEVATPNGRIRRPLQNEELTSTMEPKLSRAHVRIDGIEGSWFYSPGADPQRDAMAQQMVMQSVQDNARQEAQMEAGATAQRAGEAAGRAAGRDSAFLQAQAENARETAGQALARLDSVQANPAFRSALPGTRPETEAYDSFEVTFDISAPEPIRDACAVLRVLVRHAETLGTAGQTLRFLELRDVGPEPRRVRLSHKGLPSGFIMDSYSVHIYADGEELPSNLSNNRIDVTADEAHQFLILRHRRENSLESLPAQVVPQMRPARLQALIPAAQMAGTVDLAINEEGRVTAVQPAAGFAATPSPQLIAAVAEVRFLPALLNGQPAASRGTFALSELIP